MTTNQDQAVQAVRRAQMQDDLRQIDEQTLDARVDRYLRAEHHPIVPNSWFAPASSECIDLFTAGHFYGCISLCQAVGEALIRFMCQSNKFDPHSGFEANVRALRRRGFIDDRFDDLCSRIWKDRNNYHHMNRGVDMGSPQYWLSRRASGWIPMRNPTDPRDG